MATKTKTAEASAPKITVISEEEAHERGKPTRAGQAAPGETGQAPAPASGGRSARNTGDGTLKREAKSLRSARLMKVAEGPIVGRPVGPGDGSASDRPRGRAEKREAAPFDGRLGAMVPDGAALYATVEA